MSVDAHILCGWGSVFRLGCMCELLQASAGVFNKSWAAFCQENLREKKIWHNWQNASKETIKCLWQIKEQT